MKARIIGLSGLAGSGKDTAADILVRERGFVKLAFADPIKRIARDVYDFTVEQLWGPSSARNAPDPRYPRTPEARAWVERMREHIFPEPSALDTTWAVAIDVAFGPDASSAFLTTREACQRIGTELGRACYERTWIDLGIRTAREILSPDALRPLCAGYSPEVGVFADPHARMPPRGVVIPDVRFANELDAIESAGGRVVRIVRPSAGLSGAAAAHQSEREQAEIPDTDFDAVLANTGTIAELRARVLTFVDALEDTP